MPKAMWCKNDHSFHFIDNFGVCMKENDDDDAVVKGNIELFWVWVE